MNEDVFCNVSQSLWGCIHGLHFHLRVEDDFKEAFGVSLINSFGALFQNTVLASCLKKISKEFFMLEFFFTACEHEQGLSFLPPRISYSRALVLQNSISVCCAEMQL